MNYTHKDVEAIVNEMFPGMTFYYRDADLPAELVSKYKMRQIIRNGIFLDVSGVGGQLVRNTRFLIATNQAKPLFQINPAVAKWNMHTINLNAFFQVIDIIKEGDKTQILLVQIPENAVAFFETSTVNLLNQIINKGKESFEQKKSLQPIKALQEDEWLQRTAYPVGINGKDEFFELFPSPNKVKAKEEDVSHQEPAKTIIPLPIPGQMDFPKEVGKEKKKGLWSRLFGK